MKQIALITYQGQWRFISRFLKGDVCFNLSILGHYYLCNEIMNVDF